ncbi:MAG: type II toxin-antitoxin system VapC family toxin [Candidatus Diapherotrites archaeon]
MQKRRLRIYLDSNVLISLARQELGRGFRMLAQDSEAFLSLCDEGDHTLVLSDLFFGEIEKIISLGKADVIGLLKKYNAKTETAGEGNKSKEADKLQKKTGMHFADSLHLALALDSKCDVLVSWNKGDFSAAEKFIRCLTPEEFICEFSQNSAWQARPSVSA